MKLSFIQLENFKSYGGTQRYGPFDGKITCIVGPNGCGKSNFIDAFLFVFGFRSNKLRQTNLQGLIHHSQQHRATSCKVTVGFENQNEQKLNFSRSVKEGGYSYYYLNDTKSTLEQIRKILLDSCLDVKNGNFMILQGQVEKLSMHKEGELLQYLESITGSEQYVERINTLKQKLEELEPIFFKTENQFNIKYQEIQILRQKCLIAEQWIYWKRKLFLLNQTHFNFMKEQNERNTLENRTEIQILQNQIQDQQTRTRTVQTRIRNRIQKQTAQIEDSKRCQDELTKNLKNLYFEMKKQYKQRQKLQNEFTDIYNKRAETEQELALFIKEGNQSDELKEQIRQLQKVINKEFDQKRLQKINKTIALQIEKQKYAKTDTCLRQKLGQLKQELTQINSLDQESSLKEIKNLQRQISQVKYNIKEFQTRLSKQTSSLKFINKQIENTKDISEFAEEQHQNKLIKQAIKKGQIKGIFGPLKQKCIVEGKYAIPFNCACSHLNCYISDTVNNAEKFIRYVRQKDIGTVNVLIIQIIDTPSLRTAMTAPFICDYPGVNRLFDSITVSDSKLNAIVFWSIRNTLVAQDLTEANKVSFGANRRRSVTLRGQVLSEEGIISKSTGMVFEDPKSLHAKKENLQRQLEQLLQNLKLSKSKLIFLEQQHKQKLSNFQRTKAIQPHDIQRLKNQIVIITNQIFQNEDKIKHIDSKLLNQDQQSNDISRYKTMSSKLIRLKEKLKEHQNPQRKIEQFQARIHNLRTKQQLASNIYQQANQSCSINELALRKKQEEINRMKFQINNQIAERTLSEFKIKAQQTRYDDEADIDRKVKKIKELKLNLIKTSNQLSTFEQNIKKEKEQVDTFEIYKITFSGSITDKDEIQHQKKSRKAFQLIQQGIQLDLELINFCKIKLQSIDQQRISFESINEYFQKKQVFDIIEKKYLASKSEIDTINHEYKTLSQSRKTMFSEGFDVIKNQFPRIFSILSDEGEAKLEYTNNFDPFKGVIIKVKPPRKQWKNVFMLSGGEKTITSLALIFACNFVLKCPFYVIDEIDAALDGSKVEIVSQYIKQQGKSQFIVISHRQEMYQKADVMIPVYKLGQCTIGHTFNILQLQRLILEQKNKQKEPIANDSEIVAEERRD